MFHNRDDHFSLLDDIPILVAIVIEPMFLQLVSIGKVVPGDVDDMRAVWSDDVGAVEGGIGWWLEGPV